MKIISTLFLLLCAVLCHAQKDTLYFTKFSQVHTLKEADYYRLPYIKEGEKYKVQDYFVNGQLMAEGYSRSFDTLIWDGPIVSYYSNGRKAITGTYINGYRAGSWKTYYEDTSKLWVLSSYNPLSDTAEILRSFYKSGKVKRVEYRVKDKEITGVCYAEDGTEIKYTPFEQMPTFKGDVNKYLAQTIQYPASAMELNHEGRVLVQFTVMEDGKVRDVMVIDPAIDPSLMKEAIRVVKLSTFKWTPGKQDDMPVKVFYTLPVLFQLE